MNVTAFIAHTEEIIALFPFGVLGFTLREYLDSEYKDLMNAL